VVRALFAFDPARRGIVLVTGDKVNDWQGERLARLVQQERPDR
jgi:hypothetical protein